jgi:hypothetical protein
MVSPHIVKDKCFNVDETILVVKYQKITIVKW